MRLIRTASLVNRSVLAAALLAWALVAALAVTGQARQQRTVTSNVYSAEQATRGQQVYQAGCASCHGDKLEGGLGPMLTGDGFLSVWNGRSLLDLADKIQNTMPFEAPGTLSRQQSIDTVAYMLQVGGYPAGQAPLADAALQLVTFPATAAAAPAAGAAGGVPLAPTANLAQLMRALTFPNANILFNVQVKDPATDKPPTPVPFDYVKWGATVYPGWQAVDQAALGLIESTPLFLVPGRRCENGRPVPVDRADWKQYTDALMTVARDAYRASQSRNMDAVSGMSDRLNDACATCHKVYRDGASEGSGLAGARCQ
jgi:mono/diheme cytochrome c family protein